MRAVELDDIEDALPPRYGDDIDFSLGEDTESTSKTQSSISRAPVKMFYKAKSRGNEHTEWFVIASDSAFSQGWDVCDHGIPAHIYCVLHGVSSLIQLSFAGS
jgi:hypothetical protein